MVTRRTVRYARLADPADRTSPAVACEDVTEATPAAFAQVPGSLDGLLGTALAELDQSEDAFLADIYAPDGADGLPVLVFIHGGAYVSGSGVARWYDGSALAREGMVVVNVNYRIGATGVFGTRQAPANRGLADLVLALGWISDHIKQFGGNPAAITLAGQSAGAWYAFALAQHPQTAPLVTGLALFSLPFQPALTKDEYVQRAQVFFDALGTDLSTASTSQVLAAQAAYAAHYRGQIAFRPAAGDGISLEVSDAGSAARRIGARRWLLATTADEALAFLAPVPDSAFSEESVRGYLSTRFTPAEAEELIESAGGDWKAAQIAAITAHEFEGYSRHVGQAAQAEVRYVRLTFGSPSLGGRSPHCFELPFVFSTRASWADAPMLEGVSEEEFEAISAQYRALLRDLVRGSWQGSEDVIDIDLESSSRVSTSLHPIYD